MAGNLSSGCSGREPVGWRGQVGYASTGPAGSSASCLRAPAAKALVLRVRDWAPGESPGSPREPLNYLGSEAGSPSDRYRPQSVITVDVINALRYHHTR
jgi:hypothetical protein